MGLAELSKTAIDKQTQLARVRWQKETDFANLVAVKLQHDLSKLVTVGGLRCRTVTPREPR